MLVFVLIAVEWGPFHLGFSNSTDPEPGRCRRTDGKKWRCSREAMPDQKYCERHMNRGRHRSRKPVEGQSGHSFSGSTPTTKLTNSSTLMNAVPSSTSATLVVPGVGASDSFSSDHPKSSHVNRLLVDKQNSSQGMQDAIGLNFLSPTIGLHSSSDTFSIAKVHIPFAESNPSGFTVLTSEPLFRPYTPSRDLNTPEPDSQFSARPYVDDFLSSTSSPTGQRVTVSPLRLSGDLGMGLGVGSEWSKKQSNWVPISWETSMGGPLGEALKTTSNSSDNRTNNVSSSLNLLLRGGEGSPQLAVLSPTGVLQRKPLVSLSSSSAGSSPRAEYGRALESTGQVHTVGSALGS
uniref:Growth-regulating factor n=2 Tax=Opuntia streptacantha TaxID=393608 RepID=A0A7C9FCE2_OPUST